MFFSFCYILESITKQTKFKQIRKANNLRNVLELSVRQKITSFSMRMFPFIIWNFSKYLWVFTFVFDFLFIQKVSIMFALQDKVRLSEKHKELKVCIES